MVNNSLPGLLIINEMKKLAAPLLILFFIVLNLLSCDGLDENYSNNPCLLYTSGRAFYGKVRVYFGN